MDKEITPLRAAVIDLGTNTFDLIIVERKPNSNGFNVLHSDKSFVSLGEGGINEKRITDEAMKRAKFALDHFIQACRDYDVEMKNVHAFGTSALRDASNASEFNSFVKLRYNLELSIIDGDQEARYIYEGIKGIHVFNEESCIMDIGGGSTEFIFADDKDVFQIQSLNIGVSRILQLFDVPDQLSEEAIRNIEQFMDKEASNIFGQRDASTLIGAAGSFETFYQLVTDQSSYDEFSTYDIPFDALIEVLETLISSNLNDRKKSFWIPGYRQKMIHIAALQTLWVIKRQNIRHCYFSPSGLKEGILFSAV